MKDQKFKGTMAVGLAAILWGVDGIVLTPRLFQIDVSLVVFLLHIIPTLLMSLFLFHQIHYFKKFDPADWLNLSMVAVFGGAIGTMSIVKALFLVEFNHLSVVVLIQKLQPLFGLSLAAIILKEKLRFSFLFWAILAISGAYLMTFGLAWPDFKTGTQLIQASLFALLAAFSFGSSTVFSKRALLKYNFVTITYWRYLLTSLFMLVFVFVSGGGRYLGAIEPMEWLLFLLIGLTTGSGAIFLYYYGLKRIQAIVATISELLFPLTAILLDYFINDHRLNTIQWLGVVVLIFSIIQIGKPSPRPQKQDAATKPIKQPDTPLKS